MFKNNVVKGIVAISAIAILLAALLAVPSLTASSAPKGQDGSSQDTPISLPVALTSLQAQAAVDYWTPARMAAAIPMPLVALDKNTVAPLQQGNPANLVAGPAGMVNGNKPGTKADTTVILSSPTSSIEPLLVAYYSYPFPYARSSVPGAVSSTYPWQTIGKVFFSRGGYNYVCSGTSTVSTTGRLVMTAGHCLNAGGYNGTRGAWSYNVVFCPAWYSGAQKGCWGTLNLWTFTGWADYGNWRRDVGAIVTADTPYVGGRMQSVIGSQGFAWNWGPQNGGSPQLWWEMGYPAAAPFNGAQMITCQSSLAQTDAPNAQAGPDTNGVGCDMTPGCSGGGWIWQFRLGTYGYVNGHNDYYYIGYEQALFSPYYDTSVYNLWNAAQQDYP